MCLCVYVCMCVCVCMCMYVCVYMPITILKKNQTFDNEDNMGGDGRGKEKVEIIWMQYSCMKILKRIESLSFKEM